MSAIEEYIERHLPAYLLRTDKQRIKDGLKQFFPEHRTGEIQYSDFFFVSENDYFMQGDLIESLPIVDWDFDNSTFNTAFGQTMLVSNSCDVSAGNERLSTKNALFAQVIPLQEYVNDLEESGTSKAQIDSLLSDLRNQKLTNVFYLPPNPLNDLEYLVFLDKICWFPSSEFVKKMPNIQKERFISLTNWAYYLFIFKLSVHFCRVPEEVERFNKAVA